MKKFIDLTAEEAGRIQAERINSLLTISEKDLDPFIKVASLNNWFVESPPININSAEELKLVLAGVDGSTLHGKLQWIYLKTYLNGGVPLFRKIGDSNCEILIDFSAGRRSSVEFTTKNLAYEFDGFNKLRAIKILQIYSSQENLLLLPSISLKITVDGKVYGPESIANLVGVMQPNANVGLINRTFGGFDKLVVEIIYNNPEIQNSLSLVFI